MTSTRPETEISWQLDGGLPNSVDLKGATGAAFAFSISAAIKTRLSRTIEIGPQVEYVSSKPTYGYYGYDPFLGWVYVEGEDQQVDVLNFGFGFTYNIR